MEQARAFGLDRQVLQQTIAEAALDEEARRLGLGQSDAETMRMIISDPNFKGVGGNFDPQRFQAVDPAVRLHRAALCRRAAPGVAAPSDRRHDLRRARAAESDDRRAEPLPERAALDRIRQARRGPGRHHRSALARNARRLFRGSQGPVPRARISQDLLCRDHAGGDRQVDQRLRRGRQEAVRTAQATGSARRKSARCRRSSSRTWRRRRPRASRIAGGIVVRGSRQGARAQRRPTSISAWSTKSAILDPAVARCRLRACRPARSASRCRAGSASSLVKVGKIEPGSRADL